MRLFVASTTAATQIRIGIVELPLLLPVREC